MTDTNTTNPKRPPSPSDGQGSRHGEGREHSSGCGPPTPRAEGDGLGQNAGEPKSRAAGTRGAISRAELTRELRKLADCAFWWDPDCIPPLNSDDLVHQAAAALEEEERNARRYRRLREFAVKSWLESHRSCYYLRLLAAFEPFPRYGQTELTAEEADDQFDKTLDAWIAEHESELDHA